VWSKVSLVAVRHASVIFKVPSVLLRVFSVVASSCWVSLNAASRSLYLCLGYRV
jgi:hypothetical protein